MYSVGSSSEFYSIPVTAMMYSISCHVGSRYNGTRLYLFLLVTHFWMRHICQLHQNLIGEPRRGHCHCSPIQVFGNTTTWAIPNVTRYGWKRIVHEHLITSPLWRPMGAFFRRNDDVKSPKWQSWTLGRHGDLRLSCGLLSRQLSHTYTYICLYQIKRSVCYETANVYIIIKSNYLKDNVHGEMFQYLIPGRKEALRGVC